MPWKIPNKSAKAKRKVAKKISITEPTPIVPAVEVKEEKIVVTNPVENLGKFILPAGTIPTVPRNPVFKGYGDLTAAWYGKKEVAHA